MGVFYLCLHTVGLVRMEVVWVCFGVLFFMSEIQCLFVCLFISFVFPFCIYLLFMLCDYFIIFSLKVYLALKRDYHILFVY